MLFVVFRCFKYKEDTRRKCINVEVINRDKGYFIYRAKKC